MQVIPCSFSRNGLCHRLWCCDAFLYSRYYTTPTHCFWMFFRVKSGAVDMVSTLSCHLQVIHQFKLWVHRDIWGHRSFGHAPPIPPFPALILPVPMGAAGPSIRTWRIIMLQSMSRKRGSKSLLVSTKVWIHVVFSIAGVRKIWTVMVHGSCGRTKLSRGMVKWTRWRGELGGQHDSATFCSWTCTFGSILTP